MSSINGHIHKLKRHRYKNGTTVYFCIDNCGFKIGCEFSLGKVVKCNKCDQPFQMNEYSIRLAKPHCINCHNKKNKSNANTMERESRPTINKLADNTISDLSSRLSSINQTRTAEDDDNEDAL